MVKLHVNLFRVFLWGVLLVLAADLSSSALITGIVSNSPVTVGEPFIFIGACEGAQAELIVCREGSSCNTDMPENIICRGAGGECTMATTPEHIGTHLDVATCCDADGCDPVTQLAKWAVYPVPELDEDNGRTEEPAPDLSSFPSITQLDASPGEASVGENITFTADCEGIVVCRIGVPCSMETPASDVFCRATGDSCTYTNKEHNLGENFAAATCCTAEGCGQTPAKASWNVRSTTPSLLSVANTGPARVGENITFSGTCSDNAFLVVCKDLVACNNETTGSDLLCRGEGACSVEAKPAHVGVNTAIATCCSDQGCDRSTQKTRWEVREQLEQDDPLAAEAAVLRERLQQPHVRIRRLNQVDASFTVAIGFTTASAKQGKVEISQLQDLDALQQVHVRKPKEQLRRGRFTTEMVAVNPLDLPALGSATITLPKEGNVNRIMRCSDYDFAAEACPAWEVTDIPFADNSTHIMFTVSSFSGYAGAEIIVVTQADHLDANRSFLSSVYGAVRYLDGNWSEPIPSGDYVRVTFETNLTPEQDITIYPRVLDGDPVIEVYELNGDTAIAAFPSIISDAYNKIFLTGLQGSQDTFDLRVVSGSVAFDHIIDPISDAFSDDFETDLTKWDGNGATAWDLSTAQMHDGVQSVLASNGNEGDIFTDDIDTSSATFLNVSFWFYDNNLDSTDIDVYFFDGTAYDLIPDSVDTGAEEIWKWINLTTSDSQYFKTNFRVQLNAVLGTGENLWVDQFLVQITTATPDNTPPYWTFNRTNFTSIRYNETGQFNITYTEGESALDTVILAVKNDSSSAFQNITTFRVGASTTRIDLAFNLTMSSTNGETFQWRFYGNDTNGNMNATDTFSLVISDTIMSFAQNGTNFTSLRTGDNGMFNITAKDDDGLAMAIFSTRNTSGEAWFNFSAVKIGGTSYPIRYNYTSRADDGKAFQWKFYVNDTGETINESNTFTVLLDDTKAPYYVFNRTNFTSIQQDQNGRFNITANDSTRNLDTIIFAALEDGGSWVNQSTQRIDSVSRYDIAFNYTISKPGTFQWKFYTNDTSGNMNESEAYSTSVADTLAPYHLFNRENFTSLKQDENGQFNITFNDSGSNLDSIIFARLESGGSWANESIIRLAGASYYDAAFNYTVTSAAGETFQWKFYGNDTSGNMNESETYSLVVASADSAAPYFAFNRTNFTSIKVNENGQFNITVADAASPLDTIIFAVKNDTAAWENITTIRTAATSYDIPFNFTISISQGKVQYWKFYANDSNGFMNESELYQIVISDTPPDVTDVYMSDNNNLAAYTDCSGSAACLFNPVSGSNITLAVNITTFDVDADCNAANYGKLTLILCLNSTAKPGCSDNYNSNFSIPVENYTRKGSSNFCQWTFNTNLTNITPPFFVVNNSYLYYINATSASGARALINDQEANGTWRFNALKAVTFPSSITLGDGDTQLGQW
ncbi:hypothetical protein HY491_03385, partial [Candidatus Woesearchaeota archaeon]|nr:hypothetical protein [Candidatus Woesearchaeota archaeon]